MNATDFTDYHEHGSLVPEHFDDLAFCPYCGLYDGSYADNCAMILPNLFLGVCETPRQYFNWIRDFSNPMNHGYDFIEFYGSPLLETQIDYAN